MVDEHKQKMTERLKGIIARYVKDAIPEFYETSRILSDACVRRAINELKMGNSTSEHDYLWESVADKAQGFYLALIPSFSSVFRGMYDERNVIIALLAHNFWEFAGTLCCSMQSSDEDEAYGECEADLNILYSMFFRVGYEEINEMAAAKQQELSDILMQKNKAQEDES